MEPKCGFDVGVPQGPLNDGWRGSGVGEGCPESVAEGMKSGVVSRKSELFQDRPKSKLHNVGALPGTPFAIRKQ